MESRIIEQARNLAASIEAGSEDDFLDCLTDEVMERLNLPESRFESTRAIIEGLNL